MSLLKEAEQLASELQTDAETVLMAFKSWVQTEWEKFCGEARETRVLPSTEKAPDKTPETTGEMQSPDSASDPAVGTADATEAPDAEKAA